MSDAIRPYEIANSQDELDDLHRRLDTCRWPSEETADDDSQGVRLSALRHLVHYWRPDYDWRRCEAALNAYDQGMTTIDGVDIHFLHVRSRHADALPLIQTHGWPGSVVGFLKVIGPPTDPVAHGGSAADAFHLVIPSVPGFGFSGKPRVTGWTVARIAAACNVLMQRLGYDRFVAQGGDVGSAVSSWLGKIAPPGLLAIHTNMPLVLPPPPYDNLSPGEQAMMAALASFGERGSAYAAI